MLRGAEAGFVVFRQLSPAVRQCYVFVADVFLCDTELKLWRYESPDVDESSGHCCLAAVALGFALLVLPIARIKPCLEQLSVGRLSRLG